MSAATFEAVYGPPAAKKVMLAVVVPLKPSAIVNCVSLVGVQTPLDSDVTALPSIRAG